MTPGRKNTNTVSVTTGGACGATTADRVEQPAVWTGQPRQPPSPSPGPRPPSVT